MKFVCKKEHDHFKVGKIYRFYDDGIDPLEGVHYFGGEAPSVSGGYFYFNVEGRGVSKYYMYDYFVPCFKYGK